MGSTQNRIFERIIYGGRNVSWSESFLVIVVLTPLHMETASFDIDLGYETVLSMMDWNNSSSSSPSNGG